jgi:phosphatidylglycerol:prolipoprotein diacylglycerol transferase
MSVDRYGILIGTTYLVRFYGVIIMVGVIMAAYIAYRRAKQYGQDPEQVLNMLTWVLIAGVLGARIWHILTPPPSMVAIGFDTRYYLTPPLAALDIRKGGLGIVGAVIGGLNALILFTRKNKLPLLTWTDIIAPGLALAQAIGRWGNFVNQELYGPPTSLPWGIYIEPRMRPPQFADQAYYHPTFLYESIWNIGSAIFLIWLSRKYARRLKPGDIFAVYLINYSVIRILLEFIRLDSSTVAGLNANQVFMVVVGIGAIIWLLWRHRFARQDARQPEAETNTMSNS